MTSEKKRFTDELSRRFGQTRKLPASQSLYQIAGDTARVYIRYSKVHDNGTAFYGLREVDLHALEGHRSFLCLLWDSQEEPLIVPYEDFEDVFQATHPADDGQYKVIVYLQDNSVELYIARAGRFNVNAYFGWETMEGAIGQRAPEIVPPLAHTQVQTMGWTRLVGQGRGQNKRGSRCSHVGYHVCFR